MVAPYPIPAAPWLKPEDGAFRLTDRYYAESGGIFDHPEQYARLFHH